MADTKFSEFDAASGDDGAITSVGLQDGANVKFGGSASVTTGASPTTLTQEQLLKDVIEVTTGGTDDVEILNIVPLTLDGDGQNTSFIGHKICIRFQTQTSGSDSIRITYATDRTWGLLKDPTGVNEWGEVLDNTLMLSNTGLYYDIVWDGQNWRVDYSSQSGSNPTLIELRSTVPQGGTTGQALVKASDDDGDTEWATRGEGLPSGGSVGQVPIITDDDPVRVVDWGTPQVSLSGSNLISGPLGAGAALASGATNILLGASAGGTVTDGTSNVCIGNQAGPSLTTGGNNVCIGVSAGGALETGDNNVCIGNSPSVGAADSNVIAIGNSGTLKIILGDVVVYESGVWSFAPAPGSQTVAGLPAAAGAVGTTRYITDALTPALGVAVVGGGAVKALVWSNGSNWIVQAISP